MATEPRCGTAWLAELYTLADKIGLTGGQLAALAAYVRNQETELMEICAEIIAEHPFTPEHNDPD